ncbi:MAG: very short patch repair endonuclease [Stellaceae bacterium]
MDIVDSKRRSEMMARIRGRNTVPEFAVRRGAHALGFRFRLHRSDLPGSPDLVFPRLRIALFVHGCFWHRHRGCRNCTTPKTRPEFWMKKFEANVARDERANSTLRALGWKVVTIWECETENEARLRTRLRKALRP